MKRKPQGRGEYPFILIIASALTLAGWFAESPARSAGSFAGTLKKGAVLLASPEMPDRNFFETVIYLIRYDSSGATGLIINRPTHASADSFLPKAKGIDGQSRFLFLGGPVSREQIFALLWTDHPPKEAESVAGAIFFTGDKQAMEHSLEEANVKVRLYVGYAGWGPSQLEKEILRGDWSVLEVDPTTVFTEDPASVWPALLKLRDRIQIRSPAMGNF